MAKRFTCTEKWADPWFLDLSLTNKLFWQFICDSCDHAGIWRAHWPTVRFMIGADPEIEKFAGHLIKLDDEKYFVRKFLPFQYGTDWRNSKVYAVKTAIKILSDMGILNEVDKWISCAPQEAFKKISRNVREKERKPYVNVNGNNNGNGGVHGNSNVNGNGHGALGRRRVAA